MSSIQITKEQARRFMLYYHVLSGSVHPKGKEAVLAYINRVGCIQFDPLNIVGHNQELVLQSRVDGFKPSMLQEMLYKDRLLVDGWDKQMSIYRSSDWPYFRRYRATNLENLGNKERPVAPFLPLIRKELKERGPLSSIELEFNQSVNWPWGPTRVSRAALESMWFWGELIIHHKVHTRKVYDFAVHLLPKELLESPDPNETFEQYRDWRILRRIGGVGLLWAKQGDAWLEIPETKTPQRIESIQRLLASSKIIEIYVEGITAPLYMKSEHLPMMEEVLSYQDGGTIHTDPLHHSSDSFNCISVPATCSTGMHGCSTALPTNTLAPSARILAPLDNMLWDRRLVKELFDFDYRWEVYKPQSERTYGYYVLPVLYGDRFVARFEPGFDKKTRTLVIKNWWWEKDIQNSKSKPTKAMQRELTKCFRRFAAFLGAEKVLPGENLESSVTGWLKHVVDIG